MRSCWSCSRRGRVAVCYLASPGSPASEVELDPEEVKAATRRAELLLATGGDPRRELDLDGRAVAAMADDLDDEEARDRLEDALARLTADSEGLAAVSDGLARLRAQPDLAWRSYAGALLAEAIGED